VRTVLTAVRAELFEFQAFCRGLFVFGLRVVAVFAFTALERNDFAHSFSKLL
jgi:hypothetical protein